jgi:hypothetical protein
VGKKLEGWIRHAGILVLPWSLGGVVSKEHSPGNSNGIKAGESREAIDRAIGVVENLMFATNTVVLVKIIAFLTPKDNFSFEWVPTLIFLDAFPV